MGMREIGVHTGRMSSDVQSLRGALQRARKDAARLQSRMDHLNTMWSGQANAAMRQRFREDYERITALCDFLESLITALEHTRQSYDRCEDSVSDTVQALSVY